MEITPVAGNSGETTLRINFADYVDGDGNNALDIATESHQISFVEFNVKLNQVNVTHNGWKNLKVLGARIGGSPYCEITIPIESDADYSAQKEALTKGACDAASGKWRLGDLVDSPNVCSFSETFVTPQKLLGDHLSAWQTSLMQFIEYLKPDLSCGEVNTYSRAINYNRQEGRWYFYLWEYISDGESSSVDVQDSCEGLFNHTSFVHLRLNP